MVKLVRILQADEEAGTTEGQILAVPEDEAVGMIAAGEAMDTQAPVHRTRDLNPFAPLTTAMFLGSGGTGQPTSNTQALTDGAAAHPADETPAGPVEKPGA